MIKEADILRTRSKAGVERLLRERFGGDPAGLVAEINSIINSLLNTDLGRARKLAESSRSIFAHLPERFHPRLTAIEARIEHWSGNSVTARRKYESALRKLDALGEVRAAAQTRQGLMDVYMYLGLHDRAVATGRRAMSYFRKVGNDAACAKTISNIGNVYHRTDRNKAALKYYDLARSLLEKQGGVPLVTVDFNRANVLLNLGMIDEAEHLYARCAEEFAKHGLTLAAAKGRYSLAYLYFLSDRYTEALTGFESALELFESLKDNRSAVVTRLDLVEMNIELGQYGSAVMLGEETLESPAMAGLRYERAKCAFFVSEALLRLGDGAVSRRYLRLAERLMTAERNRLWIGMSKLARCRQLLKTGSPESVLAEVREARRLFRACGDVRRIHDADIFCVEALISAGKFKEAIRAGESINRRELTSEQQHELDLALGRYYHRIGKFTVALKYFKQAVAAVERMLASLHPDDVRFFFAHSRYDTYAAAVECLLSMGSVDKSFIEHSRALEILNQKRPAVAAAADAAVGSDVQTQKALRLALKKLSRAPEGVRMSAVSEEAAHRLEAKILSYERKQRAAASRHTPQQCAGSNSNWLESLAEDEAVVSFFASADRVGAFLATNSRISFYDCPESLSGLECSVRELQFLMENAVYSSGLGGDRNAANHYLQELGKQLLAPIRIPARVSKLIFLVDGLFAQIPYVALGNGADGLLRDRFSMRIIVNPADLLSRLDGEANAGVGRCAIFITESSELPMVAVEGRMIGELFPNSAVYKTSEATVARLRDELTLADGFVHIAAHASRSSENPLFSRIIMSDGPFFPFDLHSCGAKARLVTLSGCQTAAPGIYHGNSFSLARAFHQAGARFVLASLWPVSDKTGLMFMERFYQSLATENKVGDAYDSAVRSLSDISDNPALWSTFVLLGI